MALLHPCLEQVLQWPWLDARKRSSSWTTCTQVETDGLAQITVRVTILAGFHVEVSTAQRRAVLGVIEARCDV